MRRGLPTPPIRQRFSRPRRRWSKFSPPLLRAQRSNPSRRGKTKNGLLRRGACHRAGRRPDPLAPRKDGLDGPRTALMCQNEVDEDLKQRGPSMNEISTIGLDLAKNVFQIHGVDASGAVVLRRQLRRGAVEKFFAQLPPCLVGMEACGSAHHWARVIGSYGHQVRLMPPAYVKAYIKRNKNDG